MPEEHYLLFCYGLNADTAVNVVDITLLKLNSDFRLQIKISFRIINITERMVHIWQ